MIYDILEVFKKEYEEKGDKLILDNYVLKDGLYVKVNQDESLEYFVFKNDKKEENKQNCFKDTDGKVQSVEYDWFKKRDYYSGYLNSNKAFFDKKIHNVNYLSFFVKVESFTSSDEKKLLKSTSIKGQYLSLLNYKKFTKLKEKEIVKLYEKDLQVCNRKKDVVKKYKWIANNIQDIVNNTISHKVNNYIKIFFDESVEKYQEESAYYYGLKIFNDISHSKHVSEAIFGLSDSNMGLNSKKPYLEQKTRKISPPFLVLRDDAILIKKFFDWLKFQDLNERHPINNNFFIDRDFREKDLIQDFDYLPHKIDKFEKPIVVNNHIRVKDFEDYEISGLYILEKVMDEVFYNKQLIFNYFNDDIKVSNFLSKELQNTIYMTRYAMINYFKKYDEREFYQVVKKYGDNFVLDHLKNGREKTAKESLNLKISLLKYKGEETVDIKKMFETIKEKLAKSDYENLTKEEFFFLSGQVAYYLLAQKEQHQKKQDLLEPYLRCNSAKKLKKELEFSFFQYKHALAFGDQRFNNALGLIQAYDGSEKMSDNMDSFLVGYLANNLFFEKKES